MQDVFAELCARLNPGAGLLLALLGLLYGLLGWRLLRYLVVIDAIFVAVLLGSALRELHHHGTIPVAGEMVALLIVIGLPWLAWRFTRWSVVAMGGLAAFTAVQIFPLTGDMPAPARLLVACVVAGFVMAMHLTLYHHSAIVITGIHGGTLLLAGVAAMMNSAGEFGRGLDHVLVNSAALTFLAIAVFSAIMIFVQWADLARASHSQ